MRVLVVNVGSSSIKLSLLDHDDALILGQNLPADASDEQIESFLTEAGAPDAIGHRIVHGGPELDRPAQIGDAVLDRLDDAARLAPLHDPPAISMVRRLRGLHPDVPAVACFDTTFHADMYPWNREYAIPKAWRDAGVRRYGFHGLSHAYASRRAAQMLEQADPGRRHRRIVSCHLGAGASACAVLDGVSLDTTMGFTPVEGLVMATRSGDLDPGALVWLQSELGLSPDETAYALNHESGLLGLTGSADMAGVIAMIPGAADPARREASRAALGAIELYCVRVSKAVASMTITLGGLDALVFTGGVGEHAPMIRQLVAARLALFDLAIGPENDDVDVDRDGDADITDRAFRVRTLVIKAREDLEIARQVRATLAATR